MVAAVNLKPTYLEYVGKPLIAKVAAINLKPTYIEYVGKPLFSYMGPTQQLIARRRPLDFFFGQNSKMSYTYF